jgi:hypothetical protein
MDRISDAERLRIAGLLAEGAPAWQLHEINRCRYAIRRAVGCAAPPCQTGAAAVAAEAVTGRAGRDLPGLAGSSRMRWLRRRAVAVGAVRCA